MGLFWDLHADSRIAKAEKKASETRLELEQVSYRANKALLLCEVLWTIVRDKLDLTDQELLERVRAVDLTDGQLDGKVRRAPLYCQRCERETTQRFDRCMYCGEPLPSSPFAG
jgi:hypothetical protein